jgi:hypothetical protein
VFGMKQPGDLCRESGSGCAFTRHLRLDSKNRDHYTRKFPWAESASLHPVHDVGEGIGVGTYVVKSAPAYRQSHSARKRHASIDPNRSAIQITHADYLNPVLISHFQSASV